MLILGIFHNHDACVALYDDYELLCAVAQERVTRVKGDGNAFPIEAIRECLSQAGRQPRDIDVCVMPLGHYPVEFYTAAAKIFGLGRMHGAPNLLEATLRSVRKDPSRIINMPDYLAKADLAHASVEFYNHHCAHAYATLFRTDWSNCLIYTSDGGGDRIYYSARQFRDGTIKEIFGGEKDSLTYRRLQSKNDSLGLLYYHATAALCFRPLRHEGKVLGLAACGQPVFAKELRANYKIAKDGQITGKKPIKQIAQDLVKMAATAPREDIAASVQKVVEDVTIAALERLLEVAPARNLGLSGGLFSNVKLTQKIDAHFNFDEIFVHPAMSDQGQASGGVLHYLLQRDGLQEWLSHRARFEDVYLGRNYNNDIDDVFKNAGAKLVAAGTVPETVAQLLADGAIVGLHTKRMEYGPRALGARSILAATHDGQINHWLNDRLDRSEFMPFAPVIRSERAQEVFDLPDSLLYTARFMTVTCNVKQDWRNKIPAVVHVDGTARPQVIHRSNNPTYYEILSHYEEQTGIPVLVNTSFNAHEEPIINTPDEAWIALRDGRVDYVASDQMVWSKPESPV